MTERTTSAHAGGRVFARAVLVRRLVEHHDLAPDDALAAVLAAERHEDGPHTDLVHAEANALITAMFEPFLRSLREAFAAVQPALKALGEAFVQATAATRDSYALAPPPAGRRHDRPAWQSPYGPPTRRHR